MKLRKSYYALTHPETEMEVEKRKREEAMAFDYERLRGCTRSLMSELAGEAGRMGKDRSRSGDDGYGDDWKGDGRKSGGARAFRASMEWKRWGDCFKYLEMKVSILGNGKVTMRMESDVHGWRYRMAGPVSTSMTLDVAEEDLCRWLKSEDALDRCTGIFERLIKSAFDDDF